MPYLDPYNMNLLMISGSQAMNNDNLVPQQIYDTVQPSILESGELNGNLNMVDGFMQSSNYVAGVSGWRINADGSAEFRSLIISGFIPSGGAAADVNANVTTITGGKITTGSITALQIQAGTITANKLAFIPVDSTNVVASINASSEGITITGARISISGATTFSSGYDPSTKLAPGGAAADVNANVTTISGGKITTNSITADKMSVSQLSAITADLGSITAGSIVLQSAGFIRSGQTAWDSGTGFYLGNDSGTPRFSIGNSASNKLTWDGSRVFMKVGADGGIVMQMPNSSASSGNAGFFVQDSAGANVLKINNNAFITTFGRAFSAASNTIGTFGSDWFNMFCEFDSIPGANSGVLELPNTNAMLIKRSGGGAIMRIRSQNSNGQGKIDLFEPLGLRSLSATPGSAASYTGFIYYDTAVSDIVFSNGGNWYKVTSTLR